MRGASVSRVVSTGWPPVLAIASAVLVLGPALGRGLVQSYDIAWSPDARWTPAILGLDAPAPRVVPSDAVVTAIGLVIGPSLTQKAILVGILLGASLGAHRLLVLGSRTAGTSAPGVGAGMLVILLAQWNPFVAQRLIVGQWTVLLGYCLIPWAWIAVLRWSRGGSVAAPAAVLVAAGLGGANTWLMIVCALGPSVLVIQVLRRRAGPEESLPQGVNADGRQWAPTRRRVPGSRTPSALALIAVALGSAACWALPALAVGSARPGGAGATGVPGLDAFAARSDSRYGFVGSLLSGGGIWNPFAQGAERGDPVASTVILLVAVAALVLLVHRVRRHDVLATVLLAGALPALALAMLSAWEPARGLWSVLVNATPGGGLLRDSQKLVAPWVVAFVVAAGLGMQSALRRHPEWTLAGGALALLPIPLAATMVWGFHGRFDAVPVPPDIRTVASRLSAAPSGQVGLLPWSQYLRYPWNSGRTSVSVVPRMLDQPVLHADSLPLSGGVVAGENRRAAAVDRQIAAGADPIAAVRAQGVRYLWWEQTGGAERPRLPADARVLVDTPSIVVAEFPGADDGPPVDHPFLRATGAAASFVTAASALTLACSSAIRRRGLPGRS